MFEHYPEIMTPEQVAEACQFTLEEVLELLSSGEIPAKKIGKYWRIPKTTLMIFLGLEAQSVQNDFVRKPTDSLVVVEEKIKSHERIANLNNIAQFNRKNTIQKVSTATTKSSLAPKQCSTHRYLPLPRGENPYAQAKRACEIEKDLKKAVELYKLAIKENDSIESAVKDLTSVLSRMKRTPEAIEILKKHRDKIANQQSVNNMLIHLYQKIGDYDNAINLLEKKFKAISISDPKRTQLRWQIAYCEMRRENYTQAEKYFREIIRIQSDNISAKHNLANCLYNQNQFDKAETLLYEILEISNNKETHKLYKLIKQAKKSKAHSSFADPAIIQSLLSDFSSEITYFSNFLLKNCDFTGIEPTRIKENETGQKIYEGLSKDIHYDLERLEDFARKLGTRRPSERANYYLSAARIAESENPNQFYSNSESTKAPH